MQLPGRVSMTSTFLLKPVLGDIPDSHADPTNPCEDNSSDCPPVLPVGQRYPAILLVVCQHAIRLSLCNARHIRAPYSRDAGQCNRTRQVEYHREYSTGLPRNPHTLRFMSLRPKEVEEERRAEDEGNEDSGKDVVRRDANVIIVVLVCAAVGLVLEVLLLVDVICEITQALVSRLLSFHNDEDLMLDLDSKQARLAVRLSTHLREHLCRATPIPRRR
jgi:hypothetical protein